MCSQKHTPWPSLVQLVKMKQDLVLVHHSMMAPKDKDKKGFVVRDPKI